MLPCEHCHSDPAVAGEESRSGKNGPARFLAQFTLNGQGEIPRFARNDSEGLGMTGERFFCIRLGGPRHDPQLPQRDTGRDYNCGTLCIRSIDSFFSHLTEAFASELFLGSPRGHRPTATHIDLRGRRYAFAGSGRENGRQRRLGLSLPASLWSVAQR